MDNDDFYSSYPLTWPQGTYLEQHRDKDETRLYDCGGLPVELTLPGESYKEYDIFQTVLDLIYEFGKCAIYGDIRDSNA